MNQTRVKIKQGELCGALISNDGFEYVSFLGIPYAKPPIGRLRFKNPEPADGWTGVRNATIAGDIFIQHNEQNLSQPQGSENGLFINVHVPVDRDSNRKFPVMVFIHGGGFYSGSSTELLYLPDNLIKNGVILVTFNYRLGLLGFLSLNLPDAPGNAGLKDQTMALKWIRDNIGDFGGDKYNVTLFGESAGGVSVCHHILSPMSKGLFHRAIMQSGTSFDPWAIVHDPEAAAFEFARTKNIQYKNKEDLLETLIEASALDLANLTGLLPFDKHFFGPVVEKSFKGIESFLNEAPVDIISNEIFEAVPIIVGCNTQEGVFLLPFITNSRKQYDVTPLTLTPQEVDETFQHLVINFNLTKEQTTQALDLLRKQYNLRDSVNGNDHMKSIVDLMSDVNFILATNKLATLMGKKNQPLYYYNFSYHGNYNIMVYLINHRYKEATHADELGYIFKPKRNSCLQDILEERARSVEIINENNNDIRVSERFAELWTNFAKYGNPTPNITDLISTIWEAVTPNINNCLQIDKDIRMITNPFRCRMHFWDDFMEKFELKTGFRFIIHKFDKNQ